MTRQIAATLSDVKDLIRSRRFPDALKQLKSIDHSSLSGSELGDFYVLQSEASLYVGDYSSIPIDEAIEIFRHGPDTSRFAKAKFLKGWLLTIEGHCTDATEVFMEAHTSFMRCGDREGSARSLAFLADVMKSTGNMESAIRNAMKSAETYAELGREKNRVSVTQNLGCYYLLAGRLRDSISAYAGISSEIGTIGDRSLLVYYEMSAMPHALQGDFTTARQIIDKCHPYLVKFGRETGIYYENLGWINILERRYVDAEKALASGLDTAHKLDAAPALVSQIKRLLGDLYVATEQWDRAEKLAHEALTVSEQTSKRPEIAACYRIFAQLEQYRGNADKARNWFTEAIQLFSLLGSNYELAVTRYLAGVSGLYQNGDRHAYLWMARQYFESEQVKPYLKRINKALSSSGASSRANKRGSLPSPIVIAKSKVMTDVISLAEHVAPLNMTVFLTGPTGTGKDLMARYIHCHSGCEGEFVSVNAAAIPNPMIESELFGHKKGAFTGSDADRAGLMKQADDGTFYLNEIADASMEFQTKLLEVLETRQARRVGDDKARPVSFRLIAATNHDLKQRISERKFRLDLYHRLNEIPIELPPLSHRTEDIPHLVEYFLGQVGCDLSLNKGAVTSLGAQFGRCTLAGNVRQLQAEVKRLWLISRSDLGRMIELVSETADREEGEHLRQVLIECDWNRRKAARRLNIDESTVRYRIKKHGLAQDQLS